MPETHAHALPKGFRIEEYENLRVLGAGGFGITYLAFDHKLDGPVAIKEYFYAGLAARDSDGTVALGPRATRPDSTGSAAGTSTRRASSPGWTTPTSPSKWPLRFVFFSSRLHFLLDSLR